MAMPAAAARATTSSSSTSVNTSPPALSRQVEVAEHLVADPDRHAEERAHRRVVRREPVAVGVLAEVGQPDRLRVDDQQAEDAVALGQVADGAPVARRRCRR